MLKEGPDQDISIESFLSLGRVDHLTMVMALHPSYLSCFLKAQHALLELDGPLPRHWRHYIAVMVSGPQVIRFAFPDKMAGWLLFMVFIFFFNPPEKVCQFIWLSDKFRTLGKMIGDE